MKKTIFFILILTVYIFSAFLELSPGDARTLGQGGAYTAEYRDGNSAVMNPAGLGLIRHTEISTMYSPLLMGLDDGSLYRVYFNVAGYTEYGGYGVSYNRLGVSTNDISSIYSENVLILSYGYYAYKYIKNLSVGLKLKLYQWGAAETTDYFGKTEQLSSSNYGLDIGMLYLFNQNFAIGLVLQDFNRPRIDDKNIIKSDDTYQEKMPFVIKAGLTFIFNDIKFYNDIEFKNEDIHYNIGVRKTFLNDNFSVKTGITLRNLSFGQNLTVGLGYKITDSLRVDYAMWFPLSTISGTLGSHRISTTFMFGKEKEIPITDTPDVSLDDDTEEEPEDIDEGKFILNTNPLHTLR